MMMKGFQVSWWRRRLSCINLLKAISTIAGLMFLFVIFSFFLGGFWFLSLSFHNSRDRVVQIEEVGGGFVFLENHEIASKANMSGWMLGYGTRNKKATIVIKSGSALQSLTCTLKARGSEYCELNISETQLYCVCYQ